MAGRTLVVRPRSVVPDGTADVFVKLEWFNPTGSYKDRMALAMIEEAERAGDLRPGMTVVEYTARDSLTPERRKLPDQSVCSERVTGIEPAL
jgi:cysteine synthase